MELVMPKNYLELQEDEMTYLEGGWSSSTFGKNMKGLAKRGSSNALAQAGLTMALISGCATYSYAAACTIIGYKAARLAFIVGGALAGTIAFLGGAAAVTYLGNKRVFY